MAAPIGERLAGELRGADQSTEAGIRAQRERVRAPRLALAPPATTDARRLKTLAEV
jgi:hypothetical protein